MDSIKIINNILPTFKANKHVADLNHLKFISQNDSFECKIKNKEIKKMISTKSNYPTKSTSDIQIQKLEKFISNDEKTEKVIKEFDFKQYGRNGLPLKYSRQAFKKNVKGILSDSSSDEKSEILNVFGLRKRASDFEGMPNLSPNFDDLWFTTTKKAEKVNNELDNFLNKNEVLIKDKTAKEILDNLIQGFPEFTSIAQKKQHKTHGYSVDIHTLKVLQDSMNNPLYETLSDEGKTILKMSVLMHDFGKKAEIIDEGHQYLSKDYSVDILKRFDFPDETKYRISTVIKNHHWFKAYNNGLSDGMDLLDDCTNYEDFVIYKIFAKADLRNVSDNFMYFVTDTENNTQFNDFMDKRFKDLDLIAKKKLCPVI